MVVTGGLSGRQGDRILLARLGPDGRLDRSFGQGGLVATGLPAAKRPRAIAVDSAASILVAGRDGRDFALTRFRANGDLDTRFGERGTVTTDLGADDQPYAAAIDADGKILLAGSTRDGSDTDVALARYHADGSLDTTFGLEGTLVLGRRSVSEHASTVSVQYDGRIVLAGPIALRNQDDDVAVVRLEADGRLDLSFGEDGTVITDFGSSGDIVTAVAIDTSGRILVAGAAGGINNPDFVIARFARHAQGVRGLGP